MTKLAIRVLGVVFLITFLVYLFYSPRLKFDVPGNPNNNNKISYSNQESHFVKKQAENPVPKNGIGTWISKDINYLTSKYGQANRTYPIKGGYTDYIFRRKQQYYIVTTKHDETRSVYATEEKAQTESLKINENASRIFEKTSINPDPSFKVDGKQYNFELSDEDIKTRALIKYGNVYAQVYVDQQSNRVMGIRYLDKELLAFIKLYQLTDEEDISDDKFNNDRNNKNSLPYEQNLNQLITLCEITNQTRDLKHIPSLKINSDISHIASANLYEATGTEDVEFTEDALKGRLDNENIDFIVTSQNVGYDSNDVPTSIHSWMNSDIHRSRMLNKKYNETGGEVMRNYYSLIFIQK